MLGIKMGKRVIIVVEKLSELYQVIAVARELGVTPLIGIRAQALLQGQRQVGVERRRKRQVRPHDARAAPRRQGAPGQEGLQDSFKLLHFHIGSQITNIRTVKDAVKEAHPHLLQAPARWA